MPSFIGPWEIGVVLVIALLIFGPKKLPDLGQSLGRSISGFKNGLKESSEEVRAALQEDASATEVKATTAATETATKAETTQDS